MVNTFQGEIFRVLDRVWAWKEEGKGGRVGGGSEGGETEREGGEREGGREMEGGRGRERAGGGRTE